MPLKKQLLTMLCIAITTTAIAQTKEDYNIAVNKFQTFYNNQQAENIFNMLSDRTKALLPLDKTEAQFKQLHTQLGNLNTYSLLKDDAAIKTYKADFEHGTFSLLVSLTPDKKIETFRFLPYQQPVAQREGDAEIKITAATGTVYGTLSVPQTGKKMPVVLLIAGSGPTDRDGNSVLGVKGAIYRVIADSLAAHGIACARYDKRGVGQSAGALKDEASLTFDDMVNDAVAFIKLLKTDSRFSQVIVMGHSEGSLTGMVAAQKEKIDGYISLAGAGEQAGNILKRQLAANSKELADAANPIIDSLEHGYEVKNVPPDLASIFRPSVQPYMRSWLKYDPAKEITQIHIPILILQGTTDIQVTIHDAERLKKAAPKATYKVIEGMNHILKQAPQDRELNVATYTNESLPLSPGLMPAIYGFIKSI